LFREIKPDALLLCDAFKFPDGAVGALGKILSKI